MRKISIVVILLITGCASQTLRQQDENVDYSADVYSRSTIGRVDFSESSSRQDDDVLIRSTIAKKSQPPANLLNLLKRHLIWNRLYISKKRVQNELALMRNNQRYVDDTFKGAHRYMHYIHKQVKARKMPVELVFLPGVESQYKPFAYSFSHASGIWQIIPSTAELLGLQVNWWQDQRRDIVASTDAALKLLQKLVKRFRGDWLHALAAYNAGPLRVEKAIKKNKRSGKATDYWSLHLPVETRRYVPRLIALIELITRPQKYGVEIPQIQDKAVFTSIDVDRQLDVHFLASNIKMPMSEVIAFNGGINQRFTAPLEDYQLHVPIYMKEKVLQFLASAESHPQEQWISYKFSRGETLSQIADKFDTSSSRLAEVNRIGNSSRIPSGRYLLVPIHKDKFANYAHFHDESPDKVLKKIGVSKSYRMRRGDSLWKISRMFNVTINDLMRWNKINKKTTLFVGKTIYIKRASYTREAPINLHPEMEHKVVSKVYYPVKSGDTLISIANKFSINSKDIIAWNPQVIRKGILPARKTIVLHIDVTKTY